MAWLESATNNYIWTSLNPHEFPTECQCMSRYVTISKRTWSDSSSARMAVKYKKTEGWKIKMICELSISENWFNRPSASCSSSPAPSRPFLDLWIVSKSSLPYVGTYIFSRVCWFPSSPRTSSHGTGALMRRPWVVSSAIRKDVSHQRFCFHLHYHPTTKFESFGIWPVALP